MYVWYSLNFLLRRSPADVSVHFTYQARKKAKEPTLVQYLPIWVCTGSRLKVACMYIHTFSNNHVDM